MKYRKKLNKYERRAEQKNIKNYYQKGSGLYLYRTRNADLALSKPDADGRRVIPSNTEFKGDDYFMKLVKEHEVILVKKLEEPKVETVEEPVKQEETFQKPLLEESVKNDEPQEILKEDVMNEEKLILDQPDQITQEGKVEHVKSQSKQKPLNETPQQEEEKQVLLTEDPVEGIEIIFD